MRFHLALRDSSWQGEGDQSTNSYPRAYDVTGMPPGDGAVIRLNPTTLRWYIDRKGREPSGAFASAAEALAALQNAIDGIYLQR
jgi:hypothetical protein